MFRAVITTAAAHSASDAAAAAGHFNAVLATSTAPQQSYEYRFYISSEEKRKCQVTSNGDVPSRCCFSVRIYHIYLSFLRLPVSACVFRVHPALQITLVRRVEASPQNYKTVKCIALGAGLGSRYIVKV